MKNSEWGAVAYLTHSKYGRNGIEISINTNGTSYTGGSDDLTTVYGINANQSTTGNAYGIYDLNGNSYEYTASYNPEYDSVAGTYFGGENGKSDPSFRPASGVHFAYTLQQDNKKSDRYATAYKNGTAMYNATDIADFNTGKNVSITGDGIKEVWIRGGTNWFSDCATLLCLAAPINMRGRFKK